MPLPAGIWLSGYDSERTAADDFLYLTRSFLRRSAAGQEDPGLAAVRENLLATLRLRWSRDLTVRSYAITGTDFKHSFRKRFTSADDYDENDTPILDAVNCARLPKYVWVVEVLERECRNQGLPPVVGEVVLDASASLAGNAHTLLVHLPGVVLASEPSWGDSRRVALGRNYVRYNSGRWVSGDAGLKLLALRSKGVVAGPAV